MGNRLRIEREANSPFINSWLAQDLAVEARRGAARMRSAAFVDHQWALAPTIERFVPRKELTFDPFRAMFIEPNLTESELRALHGDR